MERNTQDKSNIQLFPARGLGAGVPLVKGSTEPDNRTQCTGGCICSTQAQPKSAGVKMPVGPAKWWKCRQIIFWRVSIFPNFVNSACIQISLAFLSFIMLSMELYKSLKMNDENCSLWSTEHPEDQAVSSSILLENACITTLTPFFLRNRLERQTLITDTELWRDFSTMCAETCKCCGLWSQSATNYRPDATHPLALRSAKWFQMTVKMTPWTIKINFASNKLLSKSLRWALGWTEICSHTRKYHLQMWYLHIVLETFLKQFSNKCNIIHIIIIKFFKGAPLIISYLKKSLKFVLSGYRCGKNVVVCLEPHRYKW